MHKYTVEKDPLFGVVVKAKPYWIPRMASILNPSTPSAPVVNINPDVREDVLKLKLMSRGFKADIFQNVDISSKINTMYDTGVDQPSLNGELRKSIKEIRAFEKEFPHIEYYVDRLIRQKNQMDTTTSVGRFLFIAASFGVHIEKIEEPALGNPNTRNVYLGLLPFYLWLYMNDYYNEAYLKQYFERVYISDLQNTIQGFASDKITINDILPNDEIFADSAKKLQEWKDKVLTFQDNEPQNGASLEDKFFASFMRFPNKDYPLPEGVFMLTTRESTRKGADAENVLTTMIADIYHGLGEPDRLRLPQKANPKVILEVNKKKLQVYAHDWKLTGERNYVDALYFEPFPIVSEPILNKMFQQTINKEDPSILVTADVIEAQKCLNGKCESEAWKKQLGFIVQSATAATKAEKEKKADDNLVDQMCTPIRNFETYTYLRDKLGLPIIEGETTEGLCERVKIGIKERAAQQPQPLKK